MPPLFRVSAAVWLSRAATACSAGASSGTASFGDHLDTPLVINHVTEWCPNCVWSGGLAGGPTDLIEEAVL